MYLDTGRVIFGVTDSFKKQTAIACVKNRRSGRVLHLGTAKVELVTVTARFRTAHDGTRLEPSEFMYRSPSGYLTITNTTLASGISADPSGDFAIPLTYLQRPSVNLSTVHVLPYSE